MQKSRKLGAVGVRENRRATLHGGGTSFFHEGDPGDQLTLNLTSKPKNDFPRERKS